ncbi:hypothetical protein ES708_33203 [subsurface metagenome]
MTVTRLTPKLPSVSVPVLSNTTVVIFLEFSNAVLFLIKRPFFADNEVETAVTKGMAKPKAWGQVITITVAILSMANARSGP